MLVSLDRRRPLVAQLVRHFAGAIREGALHPGERLPATRRFAESHAIARNTIAAAYAQLAAEGYVEARGAGGTIVARDLPRTTAGWPAPAAATRAAPQGSAARWPGPVSREGLQLLRAGSILAPLATLERPGLIWDFQYNATVADSASRRAWARIVLRRARAHENRPPPWDAARRVSPLHEALARHLARTRAVRARPDQILLVGSPQTAFRLVAQILVDPGDDVVLEDPHYIGFRTTMLARGAQLNVVPADDRGLRVDLLPRLSRSGGLRPRLVYVAPSYQTPTGASLPLARRLELIHWARRARAWIVENDHNSETFYEGTPIQSMQGLDESNRVIYVGSFSRLFEPFPSIAYAVIPDALGDLFRKGSALDGTTFSELERESLTEFLESGDMEKLVRRASRRMRSLRRTLIAAMRTLPTPVDVQPSLGGIHVYVRLPGWTIEDVDRLVERAARAGVGIHPGAPFYFRRPETPGILLGFARLTEAAIRKGIARLGEVMLEMGVDRTPKPATSPSA